MAAVRFPGPCAWQAPSSGRNAGGGGTSSGPQHALHSVRWPCWGIPARAQLGLDYIWQEGACGQPCGSTCWEARGSPGLGSIGKGRDPWQVMPDASSLK